MREINVDEIVKNIKEMCIEANHFLSEDMKQVYEGAVKDEKSALGRQILNQLQENLKIAGEDMIPICQDTGMAVIFINVGQEVHFTGGNITDAVMKEDLFAGLKLEHYMLDTELLIKKHSNTF